MGSSSGEPQSEEEAGGAVDSSKHQQQQQQQQQQQMGMPTWLNSALSSSRQSSSQEQQQNQNQNHHNQQEQQQSWVTNPSTAPSSYTNWLSGRAQLHESTKSQEQQQNHNNNNNNNNTTAELLLEQDRKAILLGAADHQSIDHHHHHHHHSQVVVQQQHHQNQQQQQQQQQEDVTSGSVADLEDCARYQNAGLKADIVTHPLYEQLLEAHVACLRIATPVDQLSRIDGQISQCHHVIAKYSILANHQLLCGSSKEELDHFMAHYVMLLKSFKEQLQHHVRVHAKEAVMACWELEQSLISLTGTAPGEGTGATMSDDEDEQQSDNDYWQDNLGFGPLIPTETERTLMERVRQELKHELKQGYRARIVDVREEILRKRRAGKLPGDTTSVLKAWWHAHSKWPYPTEDEKARLVQETGLELKQINNWFINQRKRNWHHHPSSSTSSSSKTNKCNKR